MRRPGAQRANRRQVGGWGPWRPTRYAGCVLWLRADLGITTVDAAVTSGSDLSVAGWTKTNCTATATVITDSNDGAGPAVTHLVSQTVPNMQANHAATLTVRLTSGTKTWAYLAGGGWSAYVNLTTGAAGTLVGCTLSSVANGAGWDVTLTITTPSTAALQIGPSSPGDGGVSYIADGTGTISATVITVTQRNVSAWADQSGNGNNFAQGTAGARPLKPTASVDFDGTDDYLQATGLGATLLPKTGSWFVVFEADAINTNAANIYDNDGLFGDSWPAGFSLKSAPTVHAWRYDGGGARITTHNIAVSTRYVLSCTSTGDGGALSSWLNGADPQTVGLGVVTAAAAHALIGSNYAGAAFLDGRADEVLVYNRALTDSERQTVERYLGARYGISVA